MTVQECFQRLEQLRWQIESKKERILALEALAENTSSTITGMPHNPRPSQSRMADAVCKIVDLEASIKQDEAEVERLKSQMSAAIEQVEDPKYRAVLYKRYVRGMTVDEIASDISYAERTTKRILSKANRLLEQKLALF